MPDWIPEIRQQLLDLKLNPPRESAIVEELAQHLDDYYAELLVGGATEAEAVRATLAELREHEVLAQKLRQVECQIRHEPVVLGARSTIMLRDSIQDLRYGLRMLRRSPVFAAVAVLSLALGIGANTAIFTALDEVLWKPLPVEDPQSLVRLGFTRKNRNEIAMVPAAFADSLSRADIFADVITLTMDGVSFTYDDRAERISGEIVSPNFFTALGVAPYLGVGFSPEVRAGHWSPEVVLSYRFWLRRFAGDAGVIGRTVRVNSYPFTVVGVSPPGFSVWRGEEHELHLPSLPAGQQLSQIELLGGSPGYSVMIMARLKSGTTTAQAEAAADIIFQNFLRTMPEPELSRTGYQRLRVLDHSKGWNRLEGLQAPLFTLFALVSIVLLIACANVANLLLVRATARRTELAVRASMGANRSRLLRQMLAESLLLSLLGGALAIVVAIWVAPAMLNILPKGHAEFVLNLKPDARAMFFTFTIALLTSILFGLAPAIQATRGDLAATLKAGSNASIGESRRASFRRLLVVSQVALSLMLLIVTGVCLRNVAQLRQVEYQVNPERVLLFTMKPQPELYTTEQRYMLATELVRRVSEIPGVQSVALAGAGPLSSRYGSGSSGIFPIEAPGRDPTRGQLDTVTPRFFETIGVPLLAGRDFTAADRGGSRLVAIINQSLAREFFKNENPLGRSITVPMGQNRRGPYEIVGVVADVHYTDLRQAPRPMAWFTFQEGPPYVPTLHVRISSQDTAAMTAAVRREFDALDKGFPVFDIKTLALRIEHQLAQERTVAYFAAAFGVLALLLAAVGLYGVLAYSVSRRTREIGIRMALGATRADVLRMAVKESAWLVGAGIALGAPMALATTRLISSTLFDIGAVDPVTILAAASLLTGVAAAASFLPARRATKVDPMLALRCE
jgi:predicted permease